MGEIKILTGILIVVLITIICTSCAKTFYGLDFVDCGKHLCDTAKSDIKLRIVNSGKNGFSSIIINTQNGKKTFCGVHPKDTSCYYSIDPFCNEPHYSIQFCRLYWLGYAKARAISTLHLGCGYKQPHECEMIKSGYYTLYINAAFSGNPLDVELRKDKD